MTTHRETPRPDKTALLPNPSDDTSGIVAIAWPTGRTIYRYTPEELAHGVDLYTRAMKARTAALPNRDHHGEQAPHEA
jgi:hypothetical protein